MADSTTVRVQTTTREQIRQLSEQRAQSADTVIREALAALQWRELRQRAASEAAALREDPRARQLAAEVARDMDELSAW